MKQLLAFACLAALAGCIPIGFRASTQMITPPTLVTPVADAPTSAEPAAR